MPVRRFALTMLAPLLGLCALPFGQLAAQQTAAPAPGAARSAPRSGDIPRPDELEPAVSTTPAAPAPERTPPPESGAQSAPAATRKGADSARQGADTAAPRKAAETRKAADRLQLDKTDITGNRELPKVLYIVPWKRSDLGDLVGKPVNSLLDEMLQPLDRDVFQRENRYYDALKPDHAVAPAGAAQGSDNKP